MTDLRWFENLVRRASGFDESTIASESDHPFEFRNVHPKLPNKVRKLFDDGHYSESSFEALKYLDKQVQKVSGLGEAGKKLMMAAFGGNPPPIPLNSLASTSDQDEQEGFKFIFAGTMAALRNPKGHEYNLLDDLDTCLDCLALVSMLMRRLESAGYELAN